MKIEPIFFQLIYLGSDYFFLDCEDVTGHCEAACLEWNFWDRIKAL